MPEERREEPSNEKAQYAASLLARYPDAFKPVSDTQGREVFFVRQVVCPGDTKFSGDTISHRDWPARMVWGMTKAGVVFRIAFPQREPDALKDSVNGFVEPLVDRLTKKEVSNISDLVLRVSSANSEAVREIDSAVACGNIIGQVEKVTVFPREDPFLDAKYSSANSSLREQFERAVQASQKAHGKPSKEDGNGFYVRQETGLISKMKDETSRSDVVNLIADPAIAQQLADVEATQGREAALALEQELLRQHETGLTDRERENIAIMEGLEKKFPGAFLPVIDAKGRRGIVSRPIRLTEDVSFLSLLITQEGVADLKVIKEFNPDQADLTEIFNYLALGIVTRREFINKNHDGVPTGSQIAALPVKLDEVDLKYIEKWTQRFAASQEKGRELEAAVGTESRVAKVLGRFK